MGKREGQGKEGVSITRGAPVHRAQCGCCCFLVCLPPFLVIIGLIGLCSPNMRVSNINKYNGLVSQWNNGERDSFAAANFTLYSDKDSHSFHKNSESTDKSWPVYDTCQEEGDPAEGCVETTPYSIITSSFDVEDANKLSLYNGKDLVLSRDIVHKQITVYTKSDLGCDDDTYYCKTYCSSKGGVWSTVTYLCTVTRYLSSVCFRVRQEGSGYIADSPSKIKRNGDNTDYGCYYREGTWSPYRFSSTSRTTITVTVRSHLDPVVVASDCTSGCSDGSTRSKCFGMTRKQQLGLFFMLLSVGLIGLAFEGLIVFLMYLCCKNTIIGLCGKKKNATLAYNENPLPVATAVYPAQPI